TIICLIIIIIALFLLTTIKYRQSSSSQLLLIQSLKTISEQSTLSTTSMYYDCNFIRSN
ncbi:unnamed protein product, partial [Rotaria sp. Silwood1]